jgi:membrane protein
MRPIWHITRTDWARRLKIVLIESLKSWIDHRSASKGAALAFYTLFSMTPILVLAIAVAGYFLAPRLPKVRSLSKYKGW